MNFTLIVIAIQIIKRDFAIATTTNAFFFVDISNNDDGDDDNDSRGYVTLL